MKRLAMKSSLSMKVLENRFKIVEDFTVESGKTKDIVSVLKNLVPAERTVVILKDDDAMIKRAGRNLPWVSFLSYNRLRAHDLFYGKNVLALETAALELNIQHPEQGLCMQLQYIRLQQGKLMLSKQ